MYWASCSFTFAAAGTGPLSDYFPVMQPGWCKFIKIKVPNFTNDVTTEIKVYDPDGDVIYTKSGIARNTITVEESKTLPLHPKCKITAELSGDAGGSGGTVLLRFSMVE